MRDNGRGSQWTRVRASAGSTQGPGRSEGDGTSRQVQKRTSQKTERDPASCPKLGNGLRLFGRKKSSIESPSTCEGTRGAQGTREASMAERHTLICHNKAGMPLLKKKRKRPQQWDSESRCRQEGKMRLGGAAQDWGRPVGCNHELWTDGLCRHFIIAMFVR